MLSGPAAFLIAYIPVHFQIPCGLVGLAIPSIPRRRENTTEGDVLLRKILQVGLGLTGPRARQDEHGGAPGRAGSRAIHYCVYADGRMVALVPREATLPRTMTYWEPPHDAMSWAENDGAPVLIGCLNGRKHRLTPIDFEQAAKLRAEGHRQIEMVDTTRSKTSPLDYAYNE